MPKDDGYSAADLEASEGSLQLAPGTPGSLSPAVPGSPAPASLAFLTHRTRSVVWASIEIGMYSGIGVLFHAWGLSQTPAITSAFLIQTTTVVTPCICFLAGERISRRVWLSTAAAALGTVFIFIDSLEQQEAQASSEFHKGTILGKVAILIAAVLYSFGTMRISQVAAGALLSLLPPAFFPSTLTPARFTHSATSTPDVHNPTQSLPNGQPHSTLHTQLCSGTPTLPTTYCPLTACLCYSWHCRCQCIVTELCSLTAMRSEGKPDFAPSQRADHIAGNAMHPASRSTHRTLDHTYDTARVHNGRFNCRLPSKQPRGGAERRPGGHLGLRGGPGDGCRGPPRQRPGRVARRPMAQLEQPPCRCPHRVDGSRPRLPRLRPADVRPAHGAGDRRTGTPATAP